MNREGIKQGHINAKVELEKFSKHLNFEKKTKSKSRWKKGKNITESQFRMSSLFMEFQIGTKSFMKPFNPY